MIRRLPDRKALEETQPELAGAKLPADMLTTSASGLDPDISPANAALQVARVAHAPRLGAAAHHRPQRGDIRRAARKCPVSEFGAAARLWYV